MALYQPSNDPNAPVPLDVIEQLGSYVAGQYQAAEAQLIQRIAARVAKDLDTFDDQRRLAAITALRLEAEAILAKIDTDELARLVITIAARDGEAAAVADLKFAGVLQGDQLAPTAGGAFATGITPSAVVATTQIGLELTSKLDDVKARILRTTADRYQETVARFAGQRLLGVDTGRRTRAAAVSDFLGQGITGFTDNSGRKWSIGGYTEMAVRTATNRAWQESNIQRLGVQGFDLVSPVEPSDCCAPCRRWAGKVLSTSGQSGVVTKQHATEDRDVQITIDGTLASARQDGWGHPNERGQLAPVFPGLAMPKDEGRFDPQQEKDRERLRGLERQVRALKLREAAANGLGADIEAAQYRKRIRGVQAKIREHVDATGQIRKPYREALAFQVGKPPVPKLKAITA